MSNPSVGDSTNLLLKKLVESTQNIIGGGAVSSVNGQVGIVDLTASDVGASPEFPLASVAKMIYVNKGGNDTIGDGTASNPYLTVSKASTVIIANANATLSSPYIVSIGPGTYTEDVALPVHTILVGSSEAGVGVSNNMSGIATRINGTLYLSSNWTADLGTCAISNLYVNTFTGGNGSSNTPVGSTSNTILITASKVDSYGFNMRDVASYLYVIESVITTFSQRSSNINIEYSRIGNLSILGDNYATYSNVYHSTIGSLDIEAQNQAVVHKQQCSPVTGTAYFDGTGGLTLSIDNASYPLGVVTLAGGAAITRYGSWYAPAVSADWTGADPTTIEGALDRIAAALGPIA